MRGEFIYRLLAVLLLLGVAGGRYLRAQKPLAIEQYHESIRSSALQVPNHIGPWVGQDEPLSSRAEKLLAPNLAINRRYTNVEDGVTVGLLLVHCADAHDMVGHYPLRCYPAAGWNLQSSRELPLSLGNLHVTAMAYRFKLDSPSEGGVTHGMTVLNFLLRPNGIVLRDMDEFSASILGASGQASGAGQVQVCFADDAWTDQQCRAVAETLLAGYRPVIDAILADIPQGPQ